MRGRPVARGAGRARRRALGEPREAGGARHEARDRRPVPGATPCAADGAKGVDGRVDAGEVDGVVVHHPNGSSSGTHTMEAMRLCAAPRWAEIDALRGGGGFSTWPGSRLHEVGLALGWLPARRAEPLWVVGQALTDAVEQTEREAPPRRRWPRPGWRASPSSSQGPRAESSLRLDGASVGVSAQFTPRARLEPRRRQRGREHVFLTRPTRRSRPENEV